jgi:uncharacterized coiled-coil DUF342 family protein
MKNNREIEYLRKLVKSLEEKINEKDLIIDECKAKIRDEQNLVRDAVIRCFQLRDERDAARDERDDAIEHRDSLWNFILKQFFGD